ncbi:sulfotransferase [Geomonas sp. Red875]|uniref:Sulfotransferase n=2 Tax=Geomesophilobacter sediminis TaxID=2798584 RepID=A0A8J7IR65_9BACT|nr:sulfotransferase [Geomesophilobacter sediminis]
MHGVNGFGRTLLKNGRWLVGLDADDLLERATGITRLDDFGTPPLREPLNLLLTSFERDADLNLVGRITVRSEMLRLLCNRLRLTHDRKQFPAIAREEILRPIFITGLPRSGTSFLHALLAQDPGARAPQVWEVMHPSPPPLRSSYRSDPRIAATEKELRWIDVLMPGFDRCHDIEAQAPQECIAITDHSFLSYVFESMYFVTSYRKWHDRQDKVPAYLFHKKFLQQLQCHCPGSHWVLKAPSHLMALDALVQVYPDAEIIMTHRDPLKVLASTASFAEVLRAPFTNRSVRRGLGAEVSERWAESARQAIRFRQSRPKSQNKWCDVSYLDLVRDPMAVVRGIYHQFQRELTEEAHGKMLAFLKAQRTDRNNLHRYSLEEFGLDPARERETFRRYMEFFRVVPEG